MICEAWEIVSVPFPFTDRAAHKRRPALVLSNQAFNQHGHSLLAMITTSLRSWPGDTPLQDAGAAGLSTPCMVRLKLFTLDNRLMIRRIGKLSDQDQSRLTAELKAILPF